MLMILLFFIQTISGQELNLFSTTLKNDLTEEEKIIKLDSLLHLSETKQSDSDSLHYIYHAYAYWLYDFDRKKTAQLEKKALEYAQSKKNKDLEFIQRSALHLGFIIL